MSILKASILFSRAGTVYNQVKVIAATAESPEEKFSSSKLLKDMEIIYSSPNTKDNRQRLHLFIKLHALDIAHTYSTLFKHTSDNDGGEYYSLKEE